MLSFATYVIATEFGAKWETEVSYWERSVLTLGSHVSSAYLPMCEDTTCKKINNNNIKKIIGFIL